MKKPLMEKPALNEDEIVDENLMQLELAKRLYPDEKPREAFLLFAKNGGAQQFRKLIDSNPDLKDRVDTGDMSVLDELAEQINTTS